MRLSQLHPNEGQIKGVPNNPRKISKEQFERLKDSIYQSREFLIARPFIVDEDWNILGGNMRYRACCELRDRHAMNGDYIFTDEIPDEWVRQVFWPRKKKREFVRKDNESYGEDDIELLKLWDQQEIADWAPTAEDLASPLSAEDIGSPEEMQFETAKQKRHKLWVKGTLPEPTTDLKEYPTLHYLDGRGYMTMYKRSDEGVRLMDIKSPTNNEYVEIFAQSAIRLLNATVSIGDPSSWCIITTPRRRHSEGYHFATEVCKRISDLTGIRFEPDVASSRTKNRLKPEFSRLKDPAEQNIILYDDIITTGATIIATRKLFPEKNIVTIINVCNRGAISK